MRIATWNINGVRARMDYISHWLRERNPDVVGLQELKAEEDKLPLDAFANLGYRVISHSQKSWNGVAILAKEPLETLHQGLPGQEGAGARLISTKLSNGVTFITIYAPNGKAIEHPDYEAKLEWYEDLRSYFSDHFRPTDSIILGGDFNIVPSPLDGWNEAQRANKIFRSVEERDRLESIMDFGFYDLYRELYPNTQAYTWWDYRAGGFPKNHGLRIDFLLGTSAVRKKLQHIVLDKEWRAPLKDLTPSDHAPVYADFDF